MVNVMTMEPQQISQPTDISHNAISYARYIIIVITRIMDNRNTMANVIKHKEFWTR